MVQGTARLQNILKTDDVMAKQGPTPQLDLRLLPALSTVKVDKVRLLGEVDVTKVGELLARLLNQYKDNVSGELSRGAFTQVALPALAPAPIDLSKSFKVSSPEMKADIVVKANPITVPYRLDGVAWLVTNKELTALVQLVPVAAGPTESAAIPATYDAVRARVGELVKTAFDVPDADSSTWIAIRKDLLASATNNAVSQAGLCVSAVAETPKQRSSSKIPMPKVDDISCSQDYPCDAGSCPFRMTEDRRGCGRFDLGCRIAQGLENDRRRVQANAEVAACQVAEGTKKAACELGKVSARGICEVAKVGLRALGPNFANIDTDVKVKSNGVQVCLHDFALSPALDKVQFGLDIQGKAVVDIDVKFTPLDIAGHLICHFPWSKAQAFEASLRESRLGISSPMQFVIDKDVARVNFATEPISIKAKLSPGPVDFLLSSTQMSVACPVVNAARPLAVALAPFVKELRGDIDVLMPPQNASLDLALPTQTVGGMSMTPKVMETAPALVVMGTFLPSK